MGNCIGARNIKFFVLFLFFGFLKASFGIALSLYAGVQSFLYYEMYSHENFEISLFVFVGIVQLIFVLRQKLQRDLDLIFGITIGLAFLTMNFVISDFSVSFSNNFFFHLLSAVQYIVPLVFFFLHLRTACFLIYHDVS